jgi:hypothetical protein
MYDYDIKIEISRLSKGAFSAVPSNISYGFCFTVYHLPEFVDNDSIMRSIAAKDQYCQPEYMQDQRPYYVPIRSIPMAARMCPPIPRLPTVAVLSPFHYHPHQDTPGKLSHFQGSFSP